MCEFIYVFSKNSRDKMLDFNYKMLKQDELNDIYIFFNDDELDISSVNVKYITSNVLTF